MHIDRTIPSNPVFKTTPTKKEVVLKEDYLRAVQKNPDFTNINEGKPSDASFKETVSAVPGLHLIAQIANTIRKQSATLPLEAYGENIGKLNAENIGTLNFSLEGVDAEARINEAFSTSEKFLKQRFP